MNHDKAMEMAREWLSGNLQDTDDWTTEQLAVVFLSIDTEARQEQRERDQLRAHLEAIAYMVEPHWRGAGLKLESKWIIEQIAHHARLYDDLDDENEKLEADNERLRRAVFEAAAHLRNDLFTKAISNALAVLDDALDPGEEPST